MKFIGRKQELQTLKSAYKTDRYEGILVYGRRHIGKSELIKYSYIDESCKVLYYECTKVSKESNTRAFAETIATVFDIPTPYFSSFMAALSFVFERATKEKIILVIDEYPYLREKAEGCDSVFQSVIDHYVTTANMKFILCGSYVDIMKGLILESNPLHKRFSITMNILQMDYYESAEFYPAFSPEDKVKIYSVFGGLPYYNQYVDDTKTVEENIISLIASPRARFHGEVENSLEREISKMTNANEVFMAIARGDSKFSDILSHAKVSSSPTLVDVLKRLIGMDVVKKERPINDESEKKSLYSISDRLTLFYYRYIFPKISYFSTMPPESFFEEFIKEDFETQYVPREYEEIAKQYLLRKNLAKEIQPPLYKIGKYYYDDPVNKKNGEFDVVTLNRNGYDFYEVKFTKNPVNDTVVREESEQLKKLNISYNRLGFFSKSGFQISDGENYILIDIAEVYGK